ncbi:MAG: DUF2191 domain-containing protein [Planctomycetia bacterium]|jgi:hypothetical protein|nr:DUF2191 domain-containing protein [Planctomycetia bacterium]
MKVTALIPEELISEVKELTQGKNITESLIKALSEWVDIKRIEELNLQVADKPLEFKSGFDAESARETNRT